LIRTLQAATAPKTRARPRILHVDDNRETLAMVASKLGTMAEVISADCFENAIRIVAGNPVDLVVLDIGLGESSGLDLLPNLCDPTGNTIPVILFSTPVMDAKCSDLLGSAQSRMNASIEKLAATVRDRLALLPAHAA
jgi:response regulator RpfG family c-di-GMP phosphodiesterase